MFRRQQAALRRTNLLRLFNHALDQMPGTKNLIFSHLGGSRRSVSENGGTESSKPYCLAPAVEENMASPPHLVDFLEAWNPVGKATKYFQLRGCQRVLASFWETTDPNLVEYFQEHTKDGNSTWLRIDRLVRATREKEAHIIRQGYTGQLLAAATPVENLCIFGAVNFFLLFFLSHYTRYSETCLGHN